MKGPQPGRARPPAAPHGVTPIGILAVAAVVAVLVSVSLPRLRGFARHENEADAAATVQVLARELGMLAQQGHVPTIGELTRSEPVAHVLSDAELLEQGTLLRRHGYLFAVVEIEVAVRDQAPPPVPLDSSSIAGVVHAAGAPPAPPPNSGVAIRAWPWRCDRTGCAAFTGTVEGRLWQHANDAEHWNGPLAAARTHRSWTGWSERL